MLRIRSTLGYRERNLMSDLRPGEKLDGEGDRQYACIIDNWHIKIEWQGRVVVESDRLHISYIPLSISGGNVRPRV
jgi:hypothetical protein